MFVVLISLIFALGAPGATPTPAPASAAPPAPRAQAPAPAPTAALPATQPGLSRDEGVFLATADAQGNQVIYFIAANTRHSITIADMQAEQRLNPLWPVRVVLAEDVLAYAEGTPIGSARTGLLAAPVQAAPAEPSVAAPLPANSVASTTYVLRPGDNLTRLAARFGTSIQAILDANGLPDADRVYVGQGLTIPTGSASQVVETPLPPATPVAETDSPAAVAETPTDGSTTYTVQAGDSAFLIARRLGVDQDALLAANGISNPNRVYAGQVLQVPGGA